MKKKLRNLLSLILAVAMVATTLPVGVKAADAQGFNMTSFVEDQVASGHLLVNTSVDFETYGVADLAMCSSPVAYWAGTSAADAAQSTWTGTFSFDGGRILFDGFFGSSGINSEYTYVKIAQGTQFVWDEVIFELEEDFVVVKEDDGWRVQLPTFNMTGFLEDQVANGHLLINTSVDFETCGVADLAQCSSPVAYWVGTSAADATQSTWAGTFSFDGGRILFDGFFGSSGISSEYTYLKIEKGTQFLWSSASFELAHDFVLIKESDTWMVQLPTFDITGFVEDQVASGHLLVNTSVDFETYGVADLAICSSPVAYWAGTSAADATQSTWAGTFSFDGGRILFDGFFGSSGINSEYTYVKIAQGTQFAWSSMSFELEQDFVLVKIKGLQFTIDGVVYEIEKNYVFTYDGNISGTPGLPPDITKYSYVNVNLSDIYVQGGNDLYLTTGIKDSHKYNNVVFLTSDLQVMCPNGTTDRIGSFRMHPDSGNLFIAFSYPVKEGVGIQIPKGAVAVNHEKKYGIRFVDDLGLYYTDGKWVLDNEAPVLTFQGERLKAGELYGLRLGMTEEEMKKLFAGEDSIQGKRNVKLFYPTEMFGADGKLKKGTYKMTISATDNSGNVTTYTIKVKGFTSDAPVIQIEGNSVREFDAGKKFDTSILKAKAKDANGKTLPVTYSYSKGALDSKGQLKKGSHVLYLTTTDGTGHPYRKSVVLNCYDFTDIKVTGIYYFINDDIFLSTNLGENASLYEGTVLTADNLLMNNKPGFIKSMTIDLNSESLHILCKKKAGNVMTIAENSTFVNNTSYIGIRVKNDFQAHTDGTGWLMDRILGERGVGGYAGGFASPETGDSTSWYGYIVLCIFAAGVICITYRKKEHSM